MKTLRIMGTTLAALLLFTASCSSDDSSDSSPTQKPSPTKLFEPEPEPTESVDPFAANLGETALTIGDTRDGREVDTTLHEIQFPLVDPNNEYRVPAEGNDFLGLRITQCLDEKAKPTTDSPATATYNGDWSAVARSGVEYSGDGSSWDDWPSPKFPEFQGMIPGRCMKGWIQLEVPKGLRFTSILWRPEGTPTAEWLP